MFSWSNYFAGASALLSCVAILVSWNTATDQSYLQKVDARISNCATVAGVYASQSWAYRAREGEPDKNLESFTSKAMAIGRAAQICRNEHDKVHALKVCIQEDVDEVEGHIVVHESKAGVKYPDLVC